MLTPEELDDVRAYIEKNDLLQGDDAMLLLGHIEEQERALREAEIECSALRSDVETLTRALHDAGVAEADMRAEMDRLDKAYRELQLELAKVSHPARGVVEPLVTANEGVKALIGASNLTPCEARIPLPFTAAGTGYTSCILQKGHTTLHGFLGASGVVKFTPAASRCKQGGWYVFPNGDVKFTRCERDWGHTGDHTLYDWETGLKQDGGVEWQV